MKAIHTKYIPATDRRAAKIKAYTCDGQSVMVSIDYDLDDVARHFAAARACIAKHLPYVADTKRMVYGGSADKKGYVFCFPESVIEVK